MAIDRLEFKGDASSLAAAQKKIVDLWKKALAIEGKVIKSLIEVDKANKIVKESMTILQETGNKVVITTKDMGDSWATTKKIIAGTTPDINKATQAYSTLNNTIAKINETYRNAFGRVTQYNRAIQQNVEGARAKAVENLNARLKDQERREASILNRIKAQVPAIRNVELAQKRLMDNIRKRQALQKQSVQNSVKRANAAIKAANTQKKSANTLTESIKKTTRAGRELTLTWRSMVRVAIIQLAHRAISRLTELIKTSVVEAGELEKRVAEIATLSQESNVAMSSWLKGLKDISGALGVDVVDQAESAYQALSNQVVHGAEAFDFLRSATILAIVTNAEATESVNLLSSAINAYSLNTSQADSIAASFFKTIELGRVRASEMANTLGDIAVLGSQVGVSLNELQGTIATLTIQGIKYNKAATQIRGLFIKLIKPTREMKNLFREMGVSSGEAAIQAFGWVGFLDKLQKATDGSTTKLAKFINRIRGISGALALQGKGLELLRENIMQVQDAQDSYDKAQLIALNNLGKRYDIQREQIKNFFLTVGRDTLQWLLDITDKMGGLAASVEHATNIFINSIKLGVGAALLYLIVVIVKVTASWRILARALLAHPIGIVITAVAALSVAYELLATDAKKAAEESFKAWKENLDKMNKEQEKWANKAEANIKRAFQIGFGAALQDIANARALIASNLSLFAKVLEQDGKTIINIFELMKQSARTQLAELKKDLNDTISDIKRLENAIAKTATRMNTTLALFSLEGIDVDAQINTVRDVIKRLNAQSEKAVIEGNAKAFKQAEDAIEKLLSKLRDLQIKKRDQENRERERFIKEEQRFQNERLKRLADSEEDIADGFVKSIEKRVKREEAAIEKAFDNFAKAQEKFAKSRQKLEESLQRKVGKARVSGIFDSKRLAKEGKLLEASAKKQFKRFKELLNKEIEALKIAEKEKIDVIKKNNLERIEQDRLLRERLQQNREKELQDELKLARDRGKRLLEEAGKTGEAGQDEVTKALLQAAKAQFDKEKALAETLNEFRRQEAIKEAQRLKAESLIELDIKEQAELDKTNIEIKALEERLRQNEEFKRKAEATGGKTRIVDKTSKQDLNNIRKLEEEKDKIRTRFNNLREGQEKFLNEKIRGLQAEALKQSIDAEEELIKRIATRAEKQKEILRLLEEEKKKREEILLIQKQALNDLDLTFKKVKEFDLTKTLSLKDPEDTIAALKQQIIELERLKELDKELLQTKEGKEKAAKREQRVNSQIAALQDLMRKKEKDARLKADQDRITQNAKTADEILKKTRENLDKNVQAHTEAETLIQEALENTSTRITALNARVFKGLGEGLTAIGDDQAVIGRKTTKFTAEIAKSLNSLNSALEQFRKPGLFGEEDASGILRQSINELINTITIAQVKGAKLTEEQKAFIDNLILLEDKLAKGLSLQRLEESIKASNDQLKLSSLEASKIIESQNILNNNEQTRLDIINLENVSLRSQVSILDDLIKKQGLLEKIKSGEIRRNRGGLVFAHGGPVPGSGNTDSVSAKLTPGEFVVNKNATRQFYSQLKSLNDNPQRFAAGGIVNNNIGDINMPIRSSGNTEVDVKTIGRGLHKAIKQKRIKRF